MALSVVYDKPGGISSVGNYRETNKITSVAPNSSGYDYSSGGSNGTVGTFSPSKTGVLGETDNAPTTAPTGGGGGAAPKVFNQAAADATNRSMESLQTILANALSSARTGYGNASRLLEQQEKQEQGKYDETSLTNMQNYDSNTAAALRAGRSGLSGLMAALRGGGGGGNDFARDWAQNTVGDTASTDIREGFNTFDENRRAADNSLSTFLTNLRGKRAENEDALENNERAARLYDAQQRQALLQTLAGIYSDGGRDAEAANFLAQAGAQAPTIAQNMGARVSKYDATPVQVQSPNITAFAPPEERAMGATPTEDRGIFSLLDPRRRRDEQAAGA